MNWFIYIAGLVLIGFSLYRIWIVVEVYRRKSASQIWTPAIGKVIDKQIRQSARGIYYPEITYTYSVMGVEYQNKFSMGGSLLGKANAVLQSVGGEIGLRYNPQNPKQGFANQERVGAWDLYLIAMGLITFFVVLIYYFVQRGMR